MSKKNNISFVRNEPAFIQKFKEKIGYKEEPGIEAKVNNDFNVEIRGKVL